MYSQIVLDSQTLKKFVKRLFRFIQANYQCLKNASAALPDSVTSADFDLSPGTISALTGT
jgi:hypothetical protein